MDVENGFQLRSQSHVFLQREAKSIRIKSLEVLIRSPRLSEGRTGQTKFGMYLLSRHAPCGLAWDKTRLGVPGLGG